MDKMWKFLLIIFAIVLVDQMTKGAVQQVLRLNESKSLIEGFLYLTFVENTGGAFGVGGDLHQDIKSYLFNVIPVLFCFYLLFRLWLKRNGPSALVYGYTLLIAGSLGNWLDRVGPGFVVDFIEIYAFKIKLPAFNIADISITLGVMCLIYYAVKGLSRGYSVSHSD